MAGIAGIIGREFDRENRGVLDLMVKRMMHEPFYTSGTSANESLGFCAGWVAQAGSFSDCMPLWNEERNTCLIFSGEVYPDVSEIDRLRAKGHEFDPGNAGYLVHLYEEIGVEFLENLNGWFSGLLIDLRAGKTVLFNDRYGLGRVYFHENESRFYFSSEAKSLLRVLPSLRRIDLKSLGEFFSCGCVLQNRTLFSGISLLPPGSVWTFSPGQGAKKQTYFSSEIWEKLSPLAPSDYYDKLKETWRHLLPRYFRGNGRVALSLTGGVDSRMILGWAPRSSGELPCYTFAGRHRDCMDVKIARDLARICQQPHHVIPVDGEFLTEFPSLAEKSVYLSDGAMDVTGSIDLHLQRRAREIAPVRVTGTNGGEMLRRLVAFKPESLGWNLLQPELANLAREAAMTYAAELQGHRLSFTAFKQAPWHLGSKFVVERREVTLRMPYFDNDLVALAYQAPPSLAESHEPALRLITDGNPALKSVGTDRRMAARSIPGITRAYDLFQQFTFKAEYAYDYGMPQWLAKLDNTFASLRLERIFLGRHKIHHFRVYYRDELSHYVKEVLLDPRTLGRPYLHGRQLAEIVKGHLRGTANYTLEIHKLLTIELIQRQLIEQN